MGVRLSPWQRFAAALASVICLWSAFTTFRDDGHIGMPFLGGAMLLIVALSRPNDGEQWLPPFGSYGRRTGAFLWRHWVGIVLIALVFCISFAIAIYRQNQIFEQQQAEQRLANAQRAAWQRKEDAKTEANYRACIAKARIDAKKAGQYGQSWLFFEEWKCKSERDRVRDPVQDTLDAMRNSEDQPHVR